MAMEQPNKVEIDSRYLDYLPDVARKIAIKLSMGFNTSETWNVYGAPTDEQQLLFVKDYIATTELHPRQLQNLTEWMNSVRVLATGIIEDKEVLENLDKKLTYPSGY